MAIYKVYMRSFAPWREFGAFTKPSTLYVPAAPTPPVYPGYPFAPTTAIRFGGAYHGDARGFSLDTTDPGVTARVNAMVEVNLTTGTAGKSKAWCDESRGPWMAIGPESRAVGKPVATFKVSKTGGTVNVIIDYGASNPLVKGAPDIDARGEFALTPTADTLTIVATVTGDQFPACEGFIEDPGGNKVFVGGFAPPNKKEILRLYGGMNKPKEIWFESEVVISVDASGRFRQLQGGGSGSNSTGPACEGLSMNVTQWNARIMGSIPMPSDAP